MVARGRVQNGVVVLEQGVQLPEGTAVTVLPEPADCKSDVGVPSDRMTDDELKRYRAALAEIESLPNENPGDTFSGADHDRVLYGEGQ
jgi:hypothetical protein